MPENSINKQMPEGAAHKAALKEALGASAKKLVLIYLALALFLWVLLYAADRLPAPYHKRNISSEITPWLK